MSATALESVLRILLAHRNCRATHDPTRAAIRSTINAIRRTNHA